MSSAEKRGAETAQEPVKRAKLEHKRGLEETDVGITSYISAGLPGFSGNIKQRYTDFLVNEIDLAGRVLHLEDEGLPGKRAQAAKGSAKTAEGPTEGAKTAEGPAETTKGPAEAAKGSAEATNAAQGGEEGTKSSLETTKAPTEGAEVAEGPAEAAKAPTEAAKTADASRENADAGPVLLAQHRIKLLELFGEEDLTKIEHLSTGNGSKFTSTAAFHDKKARGEIHQLVRAAFHGKIDTVTTETNHFLFCLKTKGSGRSNSTRKSLKEIAQDENLGDIKDYLHFLIYKENKETMEVESLISKTLRLKPKQITVAGTKDRRGVTVQAASIHKLTATRVSGLNRSLRGIRLGGFHYKDEQLSLGDLTGNEFIIAIRDVHLLAQTELTLDELLAKNVASLNANGFINYFGMQRFGTFSIATHHVGKEILCGNYEKAVELLLSEQDIVSPDSVEARRNWAQTRDAHSTLKMTPRRCIAEYSILRQLVNEKKDPQTKQFAKGAYYNAINQIPRNLRIMYGHAYQSYIWNIVASFRVDNIGLQVVVGDLVLEDEADKAPEQEDDFKEDVRKEKYQRAKAVTQQDIDDGKYTIFDIVLPTPGFDVKYPEDQRLFNLYKEVMGRDGLDPLNMVRKVKEFSFSGSYRKVVSKPKNIEYFVRKYSDTNDQLIKTDLDILRLKKQDPQAAIDQINPSVEGGEKTAVILKFQLQSACYATMVLREIMKSDTGRHGDLCQVKQEK